MRTVLASGDAIVSGSDVPELVAYGQRILRDSPGLVVVYERADRPCGLLFVLGGTVSDGVDVSEAVEAIGKRLCAESGVMLSTALDLNVQSIPLRWSPELDVVGNKRLKESLRFLIC